MAAVPRGACARCARAPFAPLHESRPCGPAVKWAPLPDPLPACAGRGDGERTLSLALPACAGARGWEMGGGSPPRSSPLSARAGEAQWAVAPIPADESRAPPRSSLPRPAERGEGQGEGPTSFPRRHREVRCSPPAVRARGARGRASGSEPRPRFIKSPGRGSHFIRRKREMEGALRSTSAERGDTTRWRDLGRAQQDSFRGRRHDGCRARLWRKGRLGGRSDEQNRLRALASPGEQERAMGVRHGRHGRPVGHRPWSRCPALEGVEGGGGPGGVSPRADVTEVPVLCTADMAFGGLMSQRDQLAEQTDHAHDIDRAGYAPAASGARRPVETLAHVLGEVYDRPPGMASGPSS